MNFSIIFQKNKPAISLIRINSLAVFLFYCLFANAQNIYNPQSLYESPGGLFEKDSLRDLYIDFLDGNYHNILVQSFFNNPSYRIPATVSLSGVSHDSVGVRYKGNSTFCLPNDDQNPKVPYNLDMNYWVSGQKLMENPFFPKKEKIILRVMWD